MRVALRRLARTVGDLARMISDLARYGSRSGRWWVAVAVPLMAGAAIAISVAKVAVPTVVYAFF